jgi:hypothetical protein
MAKKETEAEKKIRQEKERKKIFAAFRKLNKDEKEDKRFNEKELDIGSDRNTKTMLERMEGFSDLSEQGKKEFFKDMSDKKKLTNSERRRRGLPTLGTGKKSGGKVYSRGSRKAKYNG